MLKASRLIGVARLELVGPSLLGASRLQLVDRFCLGASRLELRDYSLIVDVVVRASKLEFDCSF